MVRLLKSTLDYSLRNRNRIAPINNLKICKSCNKLKLKKGVIHDMIFDEKTGGHKDDSALVGKRVHDFRRLSLVDRVGEKKGICAPYDCKRRYDVCHKQCKI